MVKDSVEIMEQGACNVLADYADMLDEFLQTDRERLGFCGALQYERMRDRCRKITANLQEKICYDRAAAIEKCRKRAGRKPKADAGIGEDALVLSARRRAGAPQKTGQQPAEENRKQNNDKDRERRENTFSFSVRNMQPQQAAESEEKYGTGYGL